MYLASGTAGTAGYWSIVYIVIMFAVLYFLMIRPQQKRQKKTASMLNSIKKGDKVVTIGGLHGTVMELTDDTVIVRVNDATKLTFDRSAIRTITSTPEEGK
ncbi:preprotein translocase subunit YajC [Gorillibacterium timonense]|uniref:preprotein translocase subunit YajC n=1 Tax=Gorillibacterium timonense TaxID=1689269 RepID=UPI00071C964A|nr:preprotein translocase subunit YajC [Gorillibacterium timonense]